MARVIRISECNQYDGQDVTVQGWVTTARSSGGIGFINIRDGSGELQGVVARDRVPAETFALCASLTLESSVALTGSVAAEKRAPGGYELHVTAVQIFQVAEEYPIAKKEHGTEFLMDHRHLWVRSRRQRAILRLRSEIAWAMRSSMRDQGFVLTDSPILTPTAAEGTSTLFETDFHGEPAYLAQTGQLYIEATAAALGRVYDFGPTFRAEKSKTRRHLAEFWMLDAEAAFVRHEQNLEIQERLITDVVQHVLANCRTELATLERDVAPLERVQPPFHRMRYDDAIAQLQKSGADISWGQDLGAEHETILSEAHDRPVFITQYPAAMKAFYMQPDPADARLVLNADLLAPEGYGEIIGGSERIDDLALLERKIAEFKLPKAEYEWYLDLRRYGSFPHSGFGVGLERLVAWIGKLPHVRESIPFPRLLNRLRP